MKLIQWKLQHETFILQPKVNGNYLVATNEIDFNVVSIVISEFGKT